MQAIIDKIRKIQALADRAGTEAEAAAAAGMVAELCRKHNLEIGVAQLESEETTASEATHDHGKSRYQAHWAYLSKACEEMFGVGVYRSNINEVREQGGFVVGSERKIAMVFYGLKASVQSAQITYNYLLASVESMLSGWVRETGMGGTAALRSFRIGCAKRIYEKALELNAAKKQLAGAESTALVRLENQLITAHARKLNLRSSGRIAGVSHGDAFSAGYAAGGRVNIHGANGRMLA